jgi:hypothetical protein
MKYNPIPFDHRLLQRALDMKKSGLPWTPETGCFVWDPQAVIEAPSPFPNRVYFILNMRRFLDIFGNIEAMQDKLVWLPTWSQATQLCRELNVDRPVDDLGDRSEVAVLTRLYRSINRKLGTSRVGFGNLSTETVRDDEKQWLDEVIQAELHDLDHLSDSVQQWVRTAYSAVANAYLGWRRIQEQQDHQWLPPERSFDPELLSELGHFYSDYQHQIRAVETIRRTLHLLRHINPETDPHTREQLLQVLADGARKQPGATTVMEQLTTPIESHALS